MGKKLKLISSLSILSLTSAIATTVHAATDTAGLIYEFSAANYDSTTGLWRNTSGVNDVSVGNSSAMANVYAAKGASPDSVEFVGSTNGSQFITNQEYSNVQTFSLEVWFRTTSGGKLIGYEGSTDPTMNTSYDRHLYVGSDGKLYFGIFSLGTEVVNTNSIVNTGIWHQAVAVYTAQTASLYLDGNLIQTRSTGPAENTIGYWRLGGYRLDGWPSGSNGYFVGSIGEARIYNRALSVSEITSSYAEKRAIYPSTPPPLPKSTTVRGVTYQPIGASVRLRSGLEVRVSELQLIEKAGSTQLYLTYTQTNRSSRAKIDEGSFKLFFTDGTSQPQYGFFNTLFPGDSWSRSYTFEWTKGKRPWLIEWDSDFFATKPTSKGLKWKVGPDYPAVPAKKYRNCSELNKIYPGGVARSADWINKGPVPKQPPSINSRVYDLNKGLDRDKDLLVCER